MTSRRVGLATRRTRCFAGVFLLVVATLSSAYFATQTYHAFRLPRSAYDAGSPMPSSIRPWMTFGYVAAAYGTSPAELISRPGLPAATDPVEKQRER